MQQGRILTMEPGQTLTSDPVPWYRKIHPIFWPRKVFHRLEISLYLETILSREDGGSIFFKERVFDNCARTTASSLSLLLSQLVCLVTFCVESRIFAFLTIPSASVKTYIFSGPLQLCLITCHPIPPSFLRLLRPSTTALRADRPSFSLSRGRLCSLAWSSQILCLIFFTSRRSVSNRFALYPSFPIFISKSDWGASYGKNEILLDGCVQ